VTANETPYEATSVRNMLAAWPLSPLPPSGFTKPQSGSHGALSLKRDSAAAAIKKALELIEDGSREVCITGPDSRIYKHAEFDQLHAAAKT
jgi:hypothetical protein